MHFLVSYQQRQITEEEIPERRHHTIQLKGSVKEPNKFHIYETEKITRKASDVAEYIKFFGSVTRDRHARRI